jgi:ABC-type multidrug transport system fused ATPase/permease subunit
VDLRDLDLEWWRSQIAVVSQDVHLFDATLEENIAYGKPGVRHEEIIEAARKAQVLEFANKLPEGFATRLGEKGVRLSGGQKQRISLARAFVRDPRILILDEATSALDLESERLVQDAIEAMARDRTVIIIAHHIHTIENADQIVVLDGGRIAEVGSPATLAAAGGPFARLRALHSHSLQEVRDPAL